MQEAIATHEAKGYRLLGWYVAPDVSAAIRRDATKVETKSELFPHLYMHNFAPAAGVMIVESPMLPPGCVCPFFNDGIKADGFWPLTDLAAQFTREGEKA